MLPKGIENRMEQCFDDLCTAQSLVEEYKHSMKVDDDDDTVSEFEVELTQVRNEFEDAIPEMASREGKEKVDTCLKSYQTALLGEKQLVGKFCKKLEKILKEKVGDCINNKLHCLQTCYGLDLLQVARITKWRRVVAERATCLTCSAQF